MKKQQKKRQHPRSKSSQPHVKKPRSINRRDLLKFARNGAIALPIIVTAGYFSVQSVQATICEADLTKVGNGNLTVVQVHDPQCQLCRTLQQQTRNALESIKYEDVNFLVANVKTLSGSNFAAKYAVPHVTLLLFDRKGELTQIIRGPSEEDDVRTAIVEHIKAHG